MVVFKKRRVAIRVRASAPSEPPAAWSSSAVALALRCSIAHLFGDAGLASCTAHLSVSKVDSAAGLFVVEVPRRSFPMVREAVPLITSVQKRPATVHIMTVSGRSIPAASLQGVG